MSRVLASFVGNFPLSHIGAEIINCTAYRTLSRNRDSSCLLERYIADRWASNKLDVRAEGKVWGYNVVRFAYIPNSPTSWNFMSISVGELVV
jgi:hypothetical protein